MLIFIQKVVESTARTAAPTNPKSDLKFIKKWLHGLKRMQVARAARAARLFFTARARDDKS